MSGAPVFVWLSVLGPVLAMGCHGSSNGGAGKPMVMPSGGSSGAGGYGGASGAVDAAGPPPGPGATPDDAAAAPDQPPASGGDAATGVAMDTRVPTTLPESDAAAMLVAGLSEQRFRDNIKSVAGFGDRVQGTSRFEMASAWLDQTLAGMGYTVEHHHYMYLGAPRVNTFVTKVGSSKPDRMYIVGAHLDGLGNGGAADDDGSGVSLVLEVARAFAPAKVQTDVSVRFAIWCNEETGMDGSRAYVMDRAAMQGIESPAGSGTYPEPRWLGMIQHDMMLYDHGLPPGPTQRVGADINVDYQINSKMAAQSKQFAALFASGATTHAKEYPVTVGDNMAGTDSVPFQDVTPSISMREARRVEEILRGSNPNHHQPTDLPETYSDLDYRLGFNALETTLGTIASLTGARLLP